MGSRGDGGQVMERVGWEVGKLGKGHGKGGVGSRGDWGRVMGMAHKYTFTSLTPAL